MRLWDSLRVHDRSVVDTAGEQAAGQLHAALSRLILIRPTRAALLERHTHRLRAHRQVLDLAPHLAPVAWAARHTRRDHHTDLRVLHMAHRQAAQLALHTAAFRLHLHRDHTLLALVLAPVLASVLGLHTEAAQQHDQVLVAQAAQAARHTRLDHRLAAHHALLALAELSDASQTSAHTQVAALAQGQLALEREASKALDHQDLAQAARHELAVARIALASFGWSSSKSPTGFLLYTVN